MNNNNNNNNNHTATLYRASSGKANHIAKMVKTDFLLHLFANQTKRNSKMHLGFKQYKRKQ